MYDTKRLMIIAPHCDDAEIGAGGFAAKVVENGGTVRIVVATVSDVESIGLGRTVRMDERIEEWLCAHKKLGVQENSILEYGYDSKLNQIPMGDIVTKLDKEMIEFVPDTILIPLPSAHQDHRYMWEASIAACRLKPKHPVPGLIAAYEYPASAWGTGLEANAAKGGMYVNVTEQIEKKQEALDCFETQMSHEGHVISVSGSLALSRLRGVESGFEHAELFHVLRLRQA